MIETKTTWEDSGYDCQFCGVKIYKRTDFETGRKPRSCYQGEHGCQWSLKGHLVRVGSHPDCRRLHQNGAIDSQTSPRIPIWIWVVAASAFLLLVVRFGGLAALRLLVPIALGVAALYYLYRLGRERHWW